jgi:hypothetical protein
MLSTLYFFYTLSLHLWYFNFAVFFHSFVICFISKSCFTLFLASKPSLFPSWPLLFVFPSWPQLTSADLCWPKLYFVLVIADLFLFWVAIENDYKFSTTFGNPSSWSFIFFTTCFTCPIFSTRIIRFCVRLFTPVPKVRVCSLHLFSISSCAWFYALDHILKFLDFVSDSLHLF